LAAVPMAITATGPNGSDTADFASGPSH
jgi:hypothetical protein